MRAVDKDEKDRRFQMMMADCETEMQKMKRCLLYTHTRTHARNMYSCIINPSAAHRTCTSPCISLMHVCPLNVGSLMYRWMDGWMIGHKQRAAAVLKAYPPECYRRTRHSLRVPLLRMYCVCGIGGRLEEAEPTA